MLKVLEPRLHQLLSSISRKLSRIFQQSLGTDTKNHVSGLYSRSEISTSLVLRMLRSLWSKQKTTTTLMTDSRMFVIGWIYSARCLTSCRKCKSKSRKRILSFKRKLSRRSVDSLRSFQTLRASKMSRRKISRRIWIKWFQSSRPRLMSLIKSHRIPNS